MNRSLDHIQSRFSYILNLWFLYLVHQLYSSFKSQSIVPYYYTLLYYYDRMFTLCYMLHLLFTGQDVHDLKLHVTEQKNVHFEPKFTGWSIRPLADWVCGSEVGWNRSRIQSTY